MRDRAAGTTGARTVDPEEARRSLLAAMRRYIEQELMIPPAEASRGAKSGDRAAQRDGISGAVSPRRAPAHESDRGSTPGDPAAAVGGVARAGSSVFAVPGDASREQVDGLLEVAASCAACTACALAGARHNAVPGAGHAAARVLLVGEGPGEAEDEQGLPFVGPAGQLLTKMLAAIDLTRDEVYITNIVKCRPPGNRVPHEDEVAACRGFLERQIAIIRPALIVPLGGPAAKFFLDSPEVRITRVRGQLFQWRGIPLIPTLHPAYLLRTSAAKKDAWEDLKKIRGFLAALATP